MAHLKWNWQVDKEMSSLTQGSFGYSSSKRILANFQYREECEPNEMLQYPIILNYLLRYSM